MTLLYVSNDPLKRLDRIRTPPKKTAMSDENHCVVASVTAHAEGQVEYHPQQSNQLPIQGASFPGRTGSCSPTQVCAQFHGWSFEWLARYWPATVGFRARCRHPGTQLPSAPDLHQLSHPSSCAIYCCMGFSAPMYIFGMFVE